MGERGFWCLDKSRSSQLFHIGKAMGDGLSLSLGAICGLLAVRSSQHCTASLPLPDNNHKEKVIKGCGCVSAMVFGGVYRELWAFSTSA